MQIHVPISTYFRALQTVGGGTLYCYIHHTYIDSVYTDSTIVAPCPWQCYSRLFCQCYMQKRRGGTRLRMLLCFVGILLFCMSSQSLYVRTYVISVCVCMSGCRGSYHRDSLYLSLLSTHPPPPLPSLPGGTYVAHIHPVGT